jgi:hypothetical protein
VLCARPVRDALAAALDDRGRSSLDELAWIFGEPDHEGPKRRELEADAEDALYRSYPAHVGAGSRPLGRPCSWGGSRRERSSSPSGAGRSGASRKSGASSPRRRRWLELGQLLEKRGRASTSPERAAVQVESRPAACAPPLCRALRHVVNKARPPPPRTTRRLASASRNRKPTWPRPSRIVGRPLPAGAHLRASLPSRGRAKSPLRSHGVCDTNRRHRRRRVRPALDGGRAGLLVPPGDLDALVDAVRRLTSDVELRTALLTRGLELVQELTLEAQAARAAQVIAE